MNAAAKKKGGGGDIEDPELRVAIGKKIRQLRAMNDVTQVELAHALGMTSTGAISQVEQGDKGLKLTSLIKAAHFFGIPPMALLDVQEYTDEELRDMQDFKRFIDAKKKNPVGAAPTMAAVRAAMEAFLKSQQHD